MGAVSDIPEMVTIRTKRQRLLVVKDYLEAQAGVIIISDSQPIQDGDRYIVTGNSLVFQVSEVGNAVLNAVNRQITHGRNRLIELGVDVPNGPPVT